MKSQLPLFALLSVPLVAAAQSGNSYVCTMGELTRRVAVEREGAPVPCEVAYYKDTEAPGQRQVLWNAANDAAYCDARATEFVSRLEGMNWQCAAASPAPRAASSPQSPAATSESDAEQN